MTARTNKLMPDVRHWSWAEAIPLRFAVGKNIACLMALHEWLEFHRSKAKVSLFICLRIVRALPFLIDSV